MTESKTPDARYLLALVKSLEKEVEDSEEKTRLILATLPVALILVKKDDTVDVANRLVEDMFGYSRAQIFGKSISFLFPDLSLDSSPTKVETFARRANGESFPTSVSSVEVPTPNGPRRFVFVSDISERHKLEQLKRDFFAMVSHDLRAPLANISGILELALAGKFGQLSESGDEQLSGAEKSLNRVIQMITELLEVEKLEGDQMLIEPSIHNLTTTMNDSISDVARLAEEKNIRIESWSQNVFASYDNERIQRVLVNLLSNAIKFSPLDDAITARCKSTMDWIEVSITDNGRGVPGEQREQIFSKYHQVERSDEKLSSGTGLGLAICKAIVECHGGAIGVRDCDSAESGSTFWFTLPVAEE